MLNLFVAVVVENFQDMAGGDHGEDTIGPDDLQGYKRVWESLWEKLQEDRTFFARQVWMTTGTSAGRLSAIALEQLRKMELEGDDQLLEKAGASGGGSGLGGGGGSGGPMHHPAASNHPAAALPSTPRPPTRKALRRHGGAGFAQSFLHGSAEQEDHVLWNDPTYLPCETVRAQPPLAPLLATD
jgi:hypothetical protein